MRDKLTFYVDAGITVLLLVIITVTPLLFYGQLTEYFEIPKLIFLVISTLLLGALWVVSWVLKGKVTLAKTPLDIPLAVLLITVLVSSYFSESQYIALFGNFPKVQGSVISWVTFILLYFVAASHIKNVIQIRTFLYMFLASASIVALVTLMSYFGIFLPFEFAQTVSFTPTGSTFSTAAMMLLLLPVPLFSLLNSNKYLPISVSLILTIILGITVALIGSVIHLVLLLMIIALCVLLSKPSHLKKSFVIFLVPVLLIGAALVMIYMPPPGSFDFLQKAKLAYPAEVQLPLSASWKISASALRDAPFVGSGPSTYLFNFTAYKPLEFNQLPYWSVTFNTAYNEFLMVMGTLGLIGTVAFAAVSLLVLNGTRQNLFERNQEHYSKNDYALASALAISGTVAVLLFAIHAATIVSLFVSVFIFAMLLVCRQVIKNDKAEYTFGRKHTSHVSGFPLIPLVFSVLYFAGAVLFALKVPNVVLADYYHRQALSYADSNGTLTYEFLQKAEQLNPHLDLYRVDMAQTNFALANAIATQKGASESSPSGTLTDQDRETIQTLISQAIEEGKASVTLSPRSARNWEVLAAIYRNISGVAENALTYSLDAYGRAIQLDPLNPMLRLNVGSIYYSMRNYDLAVRFFSDAINVKPDYAPAYYNLSLVLRDKGDLINAKAVAQEAVKLLQKNSADYMLAQNLLQELDGKLATQSAVPAPTATPSPVNNLDNLDLPDIDVGETQETATPAAVEINPTVSLPPLSPSPPEQN